MNAANKKQTIRQNLEQLILDIPTYILIIENISNSLDEKIGWKEFKFCFKLATSQIVSDLCAFIISNYFDDEIIFL